jgi:hypothetical protein
VVSAVPTAAYKVKTEWLKDGCVCLNVAADKNFEKDVRDKVGSRFPKRKIKLRALRGVPVHPCGGKSDHPDVAAKSVRSNSF